MNESPFDEPHKAWRKPNGKGFYRKIQVRFAIDVLLFGEHHNIWEGRIKPMLERAKPENLQVEPYYISWDWVKRHLMSLPQEEPLRVTGVTMEEIEVETED